MVDQPTKQLAVGDFRLRCSALNALGQCVLDAKLKLHPARGLNRWGCWEGGRMHGISGVGQLDGKYHSSKFWMDRNHLLLTKTKIC